jgi:hypothetical protein
VGNPGRAVAKICHAQFIQTYRVFANDQHADIRIAAGKVHSPVLRADRGTPGRR